MTTGKVSNRSSSTELENDSALLEHVRRISENDSFGVNWNLYSAVFLKRQTLSRLLYQDLLYKQIVDVPGVICEFGVQWGANMTTLINLRGIYEPYNSSRVIYGFDTFAGFPALDRKDGDWPAVGDYSTSPSYEEDLNSILAIHEKNSPLSHIRRFALVKGDVSKTLPEWLTQNPHALVAMAIFDMDIYKPTRDALEAILPRLTKGSLLVFDELCAPSFPGETQALLEVLGANNVRLRRFPHQSYCSYAVFGD